MCDELIKEIEENQNLGRRARRIKERQLQKKYKDKSIKIKSGKTFKKSEGLNKTQRRQFLNKFQKISTQQKMDIT